MMAMGVVLSVAMVAIYSMCDSLNPIAFRYYVKVCEALFETVADKKIWRFNKVDLLHEHRRIYTKYLGTLDDWPKTTRQPRINIWLSRHTELIPE